MIEHKQLLVYNQFAIDTIKKYQEYGLVTKYTSANELLAMLEKQQDGIYERKHFFISKDDHDECLFCQEKWTSLAAKQWGNPCPALRNNHEF